MNIGRPDTQKEGSGHHHPTGPKKGFQWMFIVQNIVPQDVRPFFLPFLRISDGISLLVAGVRNFCGIVRFHAHFKIRSRNRHCGPLFQNIASKHNNYPSPLNLNRTGSKWLLIVPVARIFEEALTLEVNRNGSKVPVNRTGCRVL